MSLPIEIQDPFLCRSLSRARFLSDLLINERGEFIEKPLPTFPAAARGENDSYVIEHFHRTLNSLHKDRDLRHLLNRFTLPVSNQYIERLILYSLNLPLQTKITNRELKRAVLSALLTPLRQNVGSCFATAPAILIQTEQPGQLLLDLYDLTMNSSLTRIFAGVQSTVPISPSWGRGDLNKPLSLRDPEIFESPEIQTILTVLGVSSADARALLPDRGTLSVENLIQCLIERRSHLKSRNTTFLEREAKDAFKARTDHALLKAWEYTLASFSDYKIEFYRWNLYTSLGFDPEKAGGIGSLLYQNLENKLQAVNEKTEELHREYMHAADQVRMVQTLLRRASSEQHIRQLKAELEMRLYHVRGSHDLLNNVQHRAENLSGFFAFLLEQYSQKFPEYFQEIYDAEMFDVQSSIYDDSPAGFRLVYKHGRKDPSVWTSIRGREGYIQALKSFFIATEPLIAAECEGKEGEKLLQELTTLLIHHLDTDEFLFSAIERMGIAHKVKQKGNFLENIDRFDKKPWSYTSGGSMHTLIRCYYCLEKELSEEKQLIRSSMDLLLFLLDLMKSLPYSTTRPFEEQSEKGMLMYSPTHAFIFRPGLSPFKEGWLDRGFSYTWARDNVLVKGQSFYEGIRLDRDLQQFLAETFFEKYLPHLAPSLARSFFPDRESLHLSAFRSHLTQFFTPHISESTTLLDQIDGFLRSAFPLITPTELETLLLDFPEKIQEQFAQGRAPLYTSADAYDHLFHLIGSFDRLDEAFAKQGLLPPEPLLFADTNWPRFFFGFGYNPVTESLDLWCLDLRLRQGYPLSAWRPFLNGLNPGTWGVLTDPAEYSRIGLPEFKILRNKV